MTDSPEAFALPDLVQFEKNGRHFIAPSWATDYYTLDELKDMVP